MPDEQKPEFSQHDTSTGPSNLPKEVSFEDDAEMSADELVVGSRLAIYGIIAASIIAILGGIYLARGVLTPLFIAAFFAVILYSPFSFMRRRLHFSGAVSIFVLAAGVFVFGAVIVMILSTQLWQFKNDLPRYWSSFNRAMVNRNLDPNELFEFIPFHEKIIPFLERKDPSAESPEGAAASAQLRQIAPPASEPAPNEPLPLLTDEKPPEGEEAPSTALTVFSELGPDDIDDEGNILPPANLSDAPKKMFLTNMNQLYNYMSEFIGKVMSFMGTIFLVVLLLIFMLAEVARIPEKVAAAIGVQENERVRNLLNLIRKYMTIKTFVSLIVAGLVMLLLVFMHVQYWALWGLVAFFLNFIPNIGSFVAAIPPVIIATADQGIGAGCVIAAGYIAINCLLGYWLEPMLLGDGLGISPLVVLISLMVWGALLGPVGMFLSPPLAVICKIILMQFDETKWLAILMANKAPAEKELLSEDSAG